MEMTLSSGDQALFILERKAGFWLLHSFILADVEELIFLCCALQEFGVSAVKVCCLVDQ